MNVQERRLECLRLALSVGPVHFDQLVERATRLEEYVEGAPRQQPCSTDNKD